MQAKKRYLVTSALPYANGPLHIGHLAGAYLSADVYVRYLRLMGKDVVWVCGSDEHGAAITIKAMKEGLTPREIIDKYDAMFRKSFDGMGIAFDIFHRTSEPLHYETSQDFFRQLYKNGEFEVMESEQYFDEEKQAFLADRYIIGTCPICENPDAYGDQCEKCGSSLSPNDLKPPIRSTLSASFPIKKPTKHWFLKLDKYEHWLRRWITEGELENEYNPEIVTKTHKPADWKNHVMGQCKSWLDGGLQPRAMTRDLDWGIPVPPEIDETGMKKLYVWLDAPIGYISATKQWAIDKGQPERWKDYWQKDDTALIHFIGKDNIVFHCLIFPALLREHGDYVLPVNVPANQFMNLEGRKISTSKNWAVWVHEYLEDTDFEGKQDVLRYNMIKNMPELQDSEFTWKRFQESNNNELVGNLANFINRVIVLIHKNFDGKVPPIVEGVTVASSDNATAKVDPSVEIEKLLKELETLSDFIEKFDFRNALQTLMDISTHGNQFLQFNEPWKTVKTNPDAAAATLNIGIQIVAAIAVVSQPFIPFTSSKLIKILNINDLKNGDWQTMLDTLRRSATLIAADTSLNETEHLFTRITDEVIEAQIKKLEMTDLENQGTVNSQQSTVAEVEATPQYVPLAETIMYDDFAKMDIRTGTVLTAEKMPKSDKLLKLSVDLGFETRTILSGIAKHFTPEEMVGKQVVILANLAPRKMMGIESNGMVLMAENAEGKLALVTPPESFQNGCVVK